MAKAQAVREPLGGLMWRLYLIQDYSETESIFIWKVHHCLGDGIAKILMFSNLCDDPDFKDFPQIMIRFPMLQEIMIKVFAPFIFAYYAVKLQLKKSDNNPFT